jgi:hypothetical protein
VGVVRLTGEHPAARLTGEYPAALLLTGGQADGLWLTQEQAGGSTGTHEQLLTLLHEQ